jgi:hypothetical protein
MRLTARETIARANITRLQAALEAIAAGHPNPESIAAKALRTKLYIGTVSG